MTAALGGTISFEAFENELLKAENRDLRLTAIRAERPQAPSIHASSRDVSPEIMQAALCRAAGLNVEKHFKPEVLEASDRQFRGGLGLQEALLLAAEEGGYSGRRRLTVANLAEVLHHAMIRAASTLSLPGILSGLANKMLADGFQTTEQTWRAISRTRPLNDFKTHIVYRLTTDRLEYEELPPDGTIKHGTIGEESYSMQAKTYARMFALTRVDIVNDDLGAFNDLRNRLGRGAGLALNKAFWTAFLDNATFFTGARGNLQTGAPTALTDAGTALDAANILFAAIVDAEGGPTGIVPKILLTPPGLGAIARRLYVSGEIRDTTASSRIATANIWQNRFRPLESAYLSNASYSGFSLTTWYLLADPADLPVMEVGFLGGQESPTIEQADADFDQLGIQFRGYHDFACVKAEWRAGVKSAGV